MKPTEQLLTCCSGACMPQLSLHTAARVCAPACRKWDHMQPNKYIEGKNNNWVQCCGTSPLTPLTLPQSALSMMSQGGLWHLSPEQFTGRFTCSGLVGQQLSKCNGPSWPWELNVSIDHASPELKSPKLHVCRSQGYDAKSNKPLLNEKGGSLDTEPQTDVKHARILLPYPKQ